METLRTTKTEFNVARVGDGIFYLTTASIIVFGLWVGHGVFTGKFDNSTSQDQENSTSLQSLTLKR